MSLVSKIADGLVRLTQIVKGKQDTLVSGSNIKTINGQSIVGAGDLSVVDTRSCIVNQEYAPYSSGVTTTGASIVYTGSAVQAGAFNVANNVQNKPTYGYQQTTAATNAVVRISYTQAAIPLRFPTLYQSSGLIPGVMAQIATHRYALGIANIPWYTDVNPSTNVNCIFIGYDSTDTTVQIMHNDASGVCTKIDTGWPKPTLANQYRFFLELKSDPTSGTVAYRAKRSNASNFVDDVVSGVISTNLPAANVAVCVFNTASVGGTSSVAHVQMGRTIIRSWDE